MQDEEAEKNKVGRPLKFPDVASLESAISEYFKSCEPKNSKRRVVIFNSKTGKSKYAWEKCISDPEPYTLSGLAVFLDIDRRSLINYRDRPEYFPTITRAKGLIEAWWEKYLSYGKNPNAAIFNLKNNWEWVDKTELGVNKTDTEVLNGMEELERQNRESALRAQEALETQDARSET
jgi:hypothetical protein